MDAKEFFEFLRDDNRIIRLAHFKGDACDGRGHAVIYDADDSIAIMLEDCGNPAATGVRAGNVVKFLRHMEDEPRIVGEPGGIHK